MIEPLEARIAPAVFIVSTLKDLTDSAHDTGSLRDAIYNANANAGPDTIIFQKSSGSKISALKGTIVLSDRLGDLPEVTDDLTLTGPIPGQSKGIIIDGHKHRIFLIGQPNQPSISATLSDLTIQHGQSDTGGGIGFYGTSGSLTITDVTITGNRALSTSPTDDAYGGGLAILGGTATLSQCTIKGNTSLGAPGDATHAGGNAFGGGIAGFGTITIQNSLIINNTAQAGGANSKADGLAGGDAIGGGVFCGDPLNNGSHLTLVNSTVSGNRALGGNGSNGSAALAGPGHNGGASGGGYGGGIANYAGSVSISVCTIANNVAQGGKGGNGSNSAPHYPTHGGSGGLAHPSFGGGINSSGTNNSLTIQNSTISGNKSLSGKPGKSGIRFSQNYGTYRAWGDEYFSEGGGIYASANIHLSQVTIGKNSSDAGGGIYIGTDGAGTIHNCTIARNVGKSYIASNGGEVDLGGGLAVGSNEKVEVVSSIIALNAASDLVGAITGNHNAVPAYGGAVNSFYHDPSNLFGYAVDLGPLGMHGGPTATMLPILGPGVINILVNFGTPGSNPDSLTQDQRGPGFPRLIGTVYDIGAVEVG